MCIRDSEGWDIELAFRRLTTRQRAATGSHPFLALLAAVTLAAALFSGAPPAEAAEPSLPKKVSKVVLALSLIHI